MVKVDKSELEEACQLARSFPDMSPPVQSYYIGCKKQGDELYLYWKDKQGRYWYETKSGMAFKQMMLETQKQRKMASSCDRMPG